MLEFIAGLLAFIICAGIGASVLYKLNRLIRDLYQVFQKPVRTFKVTARLIDSSERFDFHIRGRNLDIYNAELTALAKLHQSFEINYQWLTEYDDIHLSIAKEQLVEFKNSPAVEILKIVEVYSYD